MTKLTPAQSRQLEFSLQEIKVKNCERCPFVTGMGGGDVMPGFVSCSINGSRIDGTPTNGYGIPPPQNCPLRKRNKIILVSFEGE